MTKVWMALPLTSCGRPMAAASATAGWLTSADFDLGGAQAVAGDLDHVVHAADDPEVAVLVALGRVAGGVACRGSLLQYWLT